MVVGKAIEHDGEPITRDTLPSVNTQRWTIRLKARVVSAVNLEVITRDEALDTYQISEEEYNGWEQAMLKKGSKGLRVTQGRLY